MAAEDTADTRKYSFTLGQLVGFFFGPGLTVVGFLIWGAVKFDRLENQAATQALASKEQTATLSKVQNYLGTLRVQMGILLDRQTARNSPPVPAPVETE